MKIKTGLGVLLLGVLLLGVLMTSGCATVPTGPRVMVLPGQGKPFEVFQEDDAICRRWAAQQIGVTQESADQEVAKSAVTGTAIGAGLGAAIGSISGRAGRGAAIGAGYGLIAGLASGYDSGRVYGWEAQRRYDIAYQQCMYSQGNQVPGYRYRPRRTERFLPPPPDLDQEPEDAQPLKQAPAAGPPR
ncbi:MAG: glycine zipper family protein [Thermodesulfovibrio sp.]|nr:glycine zipper family protein [Thermodesulfovibrio sp.]